MCSANTEAKLQASDTPSHLEKPLTRTTLTIRQQFYFWMNSGSAAQLRQYASDMTQWHISGPKSHTSQNNFDMIKKNMSQKQEKMDALLRHQTLHWSRGKRMSSPTLAVNDWLADVH